MSCDTSRLYIFFFESFNDDFFVFFDFVDFLTLDYRFDVFYGTGKFKLRVSRIINYIFLNLT